MLNRIPFINRFFGREPWAAGLDPWSRRLYERVRQTPPRCLSGFVVESASDPDKAEIVDWALACRCGGRLGRVLGYSLRALNTEYKGDEFLVSPIAFRCDSCDRTTELIDTALHGYDAECATRFGGKVYPGYRGEGEREGAVCPKCAAVSYRVSSKFFFAHFDLIDDEPDLEPVAQDFFDAFGCFGLCNACGHEWLIASFELA